MATAVPSSAPPEPSPGLASSYYDPRPPSASEQRLSQQRPTEAPASTAPAAVGPGAYPPSPLPTSIGPGSGPGLTDPPGPYTSQVFAGPPGPSTSQVFARPPQGPVPELHGLTQSPAPRDLRTARSGTASNLRELMSLQARRYNTSEKDVNQRLRIQSDAVLSDIRALRRELAVRIQEAEAHRWRKWVVGGMLASFIPLVKRIFGRPSHGSGDGETGGPANRTEYAFQRSQGLISRILDSVDGRHGLASLAFFVFAVLYVFQNEVTLRVARTVARRIRRLGAKVESGEAALDEKDLKLLEGWRWRVLLWRQK